MKKFIIVFLLLSSMISFSQRRIPFNQFSVETSYGFSYPIVPTHDIDPGDYSKFQHWDIGARYMFNTSIGLKLDYATDRFEDSDIEKNGITFRRIDLQAVINIIPLLQLNYAAFQDFRFQGHSGLGITFTSPEELNTDRIGNYIVGFTPQFRISNHFAFNLDFSYIFNFRQHHGFDGTIINPEDFEGVTGSYMNISIGLQYYIGKRDEHADWYIKN